MKSQIGDTYYLQAFIERVMAKRLKQQILKVR